MINKHFFFCHIFARPFVFWRWVYYKYIVTQLARDFRPHHTTTRDHDTQNVFIDTIIWQPNKLGHYARLFCPTMIFVSFCTHFTTIILLRARSFIYERLYILYQYFVYVKIDKRRDDSRLVINYIYWSRKRKTRKKSCRTLKRYIYIYYALTTIIFLVIIVVREVAFLFNFFFGWTNSSIRDDSR